MVCAVTALRLSVTSFGPRLLRNFMRDTGNQVVLGTFIATFVYCLLVLRTVRGSDSAQFVPVIAITGALVLAMASLGVLIYFTEVTQLFSAAPALGERGSALGN
jgi:uncharacterized membrane protein